MAWHEVCLSLQNLIQENLHPFIVSWEAVFYNIAQVFEASICEELVQNYPKGKRFDNWPLQKNFRIIFF